MSRGAFGSLCDWLRSLAVTDGKGLDRSAPTHPLARTIYRAERVLGVVNSGVQVVTKLALGGIFFFAIGLVFVNVVLRYFFNSGIAWNEEITKACLVWMVFLGGAIATRTFGHITIEVLTSILPASLRALGDAITAAGSAILVLYVGAISLNVIELVARTNQIGVASGLPMYLFYLAIPVSCTIMSLAFTEIALRSLGRGPADPAERNQGA